MMYKLLIIDDDPDFIDDITLILQKDYRVDSTHKPDEGIKMVRDSDPDVVLLDLMFENSTLNGLDILHRIRNQDENLPVIMITDYGSVDTAVEAMRLGADDYISKSPQLAELNLIIERALRNRNRTLQSKSLQEETRKPFHVIIGESRAIRHILGLIELMAGNHNPVLITGESGTGKELVARQIHGHSDRKHQPFIALNCAAIPKELLESELFGYEKGAFTGAGKRKLGKFEIATDGVMFFDEISELSMSAQVKLLRVLQEKEFSRVGGNATIQTNARIIAATNSDLGELVAAGKFREDLFYRLDVLRIEASPLRERIDDIEPLADHFLALACDDMKIPRKRISREMMDYLQAYDWPGNVRELRNAMIRAAILTPGTRVGLIPDLVRGSPKTVAQIPRTKADMEALRREAADAARREVERRYVHHLLEKHQGHVTRAAREAGMNRTNFHKMIKRCGLLHTVTDKPD